MIEDFSLVYSSPNHFLAFFFFSLSPSQICFESPFFFVFDASFLSVIDFFSRLPPSVGFLTHSTNNHGRSCDTHRNFNAAGDRL
jgi:hypothetical protein